MTEERKAIVKYLRDVADLYAKPTRTLGEGDDTRGQVADVLDVCADDIEGKHPDTLPNPMLELAEKLRWMLKP